MSATIYPNPLNEEMAWKVGHATAQYLKRSRQNIPAEQKVKLENTIVVGRDMRPSSPSTGQRVDRRHSLDRDERDRHRHDRYDRSSISPSITSTPSAASRRRHRTIRSNTTASKSAAPRPSQSARPPGWTTSSASPRRFRVGQTGLNGKIRSSISGPNTTARAEISGAQATAARRDRRQQWHGRQNGSRRFRRCPQSGDHPDSFRDHRQLYARSQSARRSQSDDAQAEDEPNIKPDLGACFDGDADRCMFLDEKRQDASAAI